MSVNEESEMLINLIRADNHVILVKTWGYSDNTAMKTADSKKLRGEYSGPRCPLTTIKNCFASLKTDLTVIIGTGQYLLVKYDVLLYGNSFSVKYM